MRNPIQWWRPALCLFAIAPLVGCDGGPAAPIDTREDPIVAGADINDPDGGFDTNREAPGFGDDFLVSGEAERTLDDPLLAIPEIQAMLNDRARYGVWAVRVTWGHLERTDHDVFAPVDWTGSASVGDGVLVGVRAISFERLQRDRVVGPRASRTELNWISHTTIAFDGIQLLVIDPTDNDFANSLTLDMPLFQESFDIPLPVDELDKTFDVDDMGHQVRVQIRREEPSGACARGWVSGLWQNRPNAEALSVGVSGTFKGNLSNTSGDELASIVGFYGVNDAGRRVLFGKIINEQGNFRAFVRGTWALSPDSIGAGSFTARLLDDERAALGFMHGVWESRDAGGAGFFHGAWRTECDDNDPTDDDNGGVDDYTDMGGPGVF